MKTAIIELFTEIIKKYPNEYAVLEEKDSITYRELAGYATNIKNKLIESKNKIIAVFLPKSINLVASDIAILALGSAFMNMDCKLPQERVKAILNHVQPDIVITTHELHDKYEEAMKKQQIVYIENIKKECDDEWQVNMDGVIDTNPFCVINTSGSTGIPKAVILNNRSFFDFLSWVDEVYCFGENEEKIACLTPTYFDIFVFELCMLMSKAAKMVLFDAKYSTFPKMLVEKLANEHITFLFWVPTIMVNIANMNLLDNIQLPDLKKVWFAGEIFPTKQFLYWYDHLKDVQFTNLYGPIEITLDCTYYIVDRRMDEKEPLPIGLPCRNTDIIILDEDNKRCKKMEKGELCVRGTSLALGYYNDMEKTKSVFVQNPLNDKYPELIYRTGDIVYENEEGLIMFCGRRDSLIKHSGYRIELSEIEHIVVDKCKLVKNCCAVYPKEKKEIYLFYEWDKEIDKAVFFAEMSKYIPKYMIPKVFIQCEQMPQNANGKIDRLRLAQEAVKM